MAALVHSSSIHSCPFKQGSALGNRVPRQHVRCSRTTRQRTYALFGGGKDGEKGGNPFGNMGAMMENIKKAQVVVQEQSGKIQSELAATVLEGYSEDETVCVTMSGNQEPKSCDITSEAFDMGVDEVNKRVTEAMQDAHAKSTAMMKDRMQGLASSLGLPPNM